MHKREKAKRDPLAGIDRKVVRKGAEREGGRESVTLIRIESRCEDLDSFETR